MFYDVVDRKLLFIVKVEDKDIFLSEHEKELTISDLRNLYMRFFKLLEMILAFKVERFKDNDEENVVRELDKTFLFFRIDIDVNTLLNKVLKVDKIFTPFHQFPFAIGFVVKEVDKTHIVQIEKTVMSLFINTKTTNNKNGSIEEELRVDVSLLSDLSNNMVGRLLYYNNSQKVLYSYPIDENQKELLEKLKKKVKEYMKTFVDTKTGKLRTIKKDLKEFIEYMILLSMLVS